MHELGHTLGLAHGGLVKDGMGIIRRDGSTMYKPNYFSVMNYSWSDTGLLYQSSPASPIQAFIEYQDFDLPPLDESSLTESVGLNMPAGVPVAGLLTRARVAGEGRKPDGRLVPAEGAIDWNRNGVNSDPKVRVSVNGDTEYITLKGTLNEWERLQFDVGRIGSIWRYYQQSP
jgi:hypothetical protein